MRKISKEELSEILKQHSIWLESEYTMGSRADLSRADLRNTNLSRAFLFKANLEEANLSGADLSRAKLYTAKLYTAKGITIFQHEQHLAVAFDDDKYIAIGCKTYRTGNWAKNFEKIGANEGYSNSQIKMYGQFIKSISNI